MKIISPLLSALIVLGLCAPFAQGATKKELQDRFEKRFPQLLAYKQEGKVGENMEGFVEAVKKEFLSDAALSKLIDDDNADRKALYQLIADEEKTSVTTVAESAAKRNYEKAPSGHYLKARDGTFRKKS